MKKITGTFINIYHICSRQLWLHAHGVQMEQRSSLVAEGKWIHETSYAQRSQNYKELSLDGIKIDHYDPKNKVIHEVKKSNKKENAYIAQLKYYIYKLELSGVLGVTGLLEYPKLRIKKEVFLSPEDRLVIPRWEQAINAIITKTSCPPVIQKPICKRCSYYEFCYADEL